MAAVSGQRYGIAVANGSVALDLAVSALGIGPGDEVILPTFTIISCAAAIVRAGAIPVVVDLEPLTWNMDPTQIEFKNNAADQSHHGRSHLRATSGHGPDHRHRTSA